MSSNAESFRFREWDRDRCFDGLGLCGRAEPIVLLRFVCFRAFLDRAPSLVCTMAVVAIWLVYVGWAGEHVDLVDERAG